MCAGLTRKVDRMLFNGGARDVPGCCPVLFFGVNIPSSGLASFGEGASPFFEVKKRPDSLFHKRLTIKFSWRRRKSVKCINLTENLLQR